jgi:hypothetical protein
MAHRLELGPLHLARIPADQPDAVGFIPCGMGEFGFLGREAPDLAASEDFARLFPPAPRRDIKDDAYVASTKKEPPRRGRGGRRK